MNQIIKKEIEFGGQTLSLETGRLALQANGSVLARLGDTVVLATAVMGEAKEELGYFPLVVDFEEKLYAGGKIKTSRFVKREGRPSDGAILTGRLIDRSIRPLFPKKDFYNEVQVILTMLSVDQENSPAILGMIAAYAALTISNIPWQGSLGAARIGFKEGNFLLNPGNGELEFSDLNLILAGSKEGILMVEAEANELPEAEVIKALEWGHQQIQPIIALIEELQKEVGQEKLPVVEKEANLEIKQAILAYVQEKMGDELFSPTRASRDSAREEFLEELFLVFEGKVTKNEMTEIFDEAVRKAVRVRILEKNLRPDGRDDLTVVRPLNIEVGVLPRTHGSALFARGETQVLTIATLGSTSLEQLIEGPTGEETKRFMHHYNFPPFSTGEVGRLGWPGRREVGHGALAERALLPVIPSEEEFPYAIRLVSEVLSSAGSTSMASVCGSTLALMDTGVPIKSAVAGVAMGLVTSEDQKQSKILTDIAALEDFYGDMDFKVAGTKNGINALQMDIKLAKVSHEILTVALNQARDARLFILQKMAQVIGEPRQELSIYAPRVISVLIDPKKIGEVIGPGGKVVRNIQDETETIIDIKEDGTVHISGKSEENAQRARAWIESLTKEVKVGEIYQGKVTRILDFGALVEILPGKEGLVHISEFSPGYVSNVRDFVKEGEELKVKVVSLDERGKIRLSVKALKTEGFTEGEFGGGKSRFAKKPRSGIDHRTRPSYRTPYHQKPHYRRGH